MSVHVHVLYTTALFQSGRETSSTDLVSPRSVVLDLAGC